MPDLLPSAESVAELVAQFEQALADAKSGRDAQAARDRFLGRKNSVVASWMQRIATAPPDDRRNIGRFANELRQALEARWTAHVERASALVRPAGAVDVTLPGRVPALGHRHPLTVVRDRMEDVFTRMGFAIVEGPEIEDEWHCFDALNMPAEHPARDMQDTLYLASPVQGESGRAYTPINVYSTQAAEPYSKNGLFQITTDMKINRSFKLGPRRLDLSLAGTNIFNNHVINRVDRVTGRGRVAGRGEYDSSVFPDVNAYTLVSSVDDPSNYGPGAQWRLTLDYDF